MNYVMPTLVNDHDHRYQTNIVVFYIRKKKKKNIIVPKDITLCH